MPLYRIHLSPGRAIDVSTYVRWASPAIQTVDQHGLYWMPRHTNHVTRQHAALALRHARQVGQRIEKFTY